MKSQEIIVIDDFLDDPDSIRHLALQQNFVKMHCAGVRTEQRFLHIAHRSEQLIAIVYGQASGDVNAFGGLFPEKWKRTPSPPDDEDISSPALFSNWRDRGRSVLPDRKGVCAGYGREAQKRVEQSMSIHSAFISR